MSPDELHEPLERALREGHLIPVVFTSAKTGAGIAELLDVIVKLLPNPAEGNPPAYVVTKPATAQAHRPASRFPIPASTCSRTSSRSRSIPTSAGSRCSACTRAA